MSTKPRWRFAIGDQPSNAPMGVIPAGFPEGTRLTQPRGGFVLWVELPKRMDSVELYRRALEDGISISLPRP